MGFDRDEAAAIAQQRLDGLCKLSFDQLRDLPSDGRSWSDAPVSSTRSSIRPCGMIARATMCASWCWSMTVSGLRTHSPLTVDFVIAPEGTCVDEGDL